MSLDRLSLNTLAGRVICHLVLGPRQHALLIDPAWKIGGADLVWRRGVYFLHVTQSQEAPALTADDGQHLGVNLGMVNLATDSDGQGFSGAQVRRVRKRSHSHRQRLQKAATKATKRRLKHVSGREHCFQKDTTHCLSKALVHKATQSRKALALEDLTGIRQRATVRREQRYERHSWAFFQLRTFLSYKAAWAGVRLVLVDPRNTSRTCAVCGHCDKANRKSQAEFVCQSCGHAAPADWNAAITLSRATVKQPMVAPGLRAS